MEVVRGYLLRLTAGAFLSAGLLALIPKGTSKKAAAVLCGLVMLLLALTPLAQLDYDALSEAISRLELERRKRERESRSGTRSLWPGSYQAAYRHIYWTKPPRWG